MPEFAFRPATDIAARIRRGEVSPVAVVDEFLDRITTIDDTIHSYVTLREHDARDEAHEAERAVERGTPLGPLHGVPVAIKDLTAVKDVRCTFGSTAFADHVPSEDAVSVARLREAGAIVLGKTNTPEFGRKTNTTNHVFGATGNPWDPARTAGGSSGGSAAAVAAGLAPLALGSDAAGSIRVPAAACGVFGLMPDFGRVPLGNARADAFVNTLPYTYEGPITRTVEDACLMLGVLADPDPTDPYSLPTQPNRYADLSTQGSVDRVSVAYSPDLGICRVADAVTQVVAEAVDRFREAGMEVSRVERVFPMEYETVHDALSILLQVRYLGLHDNLKRDFDVDLLDPALDITPEVVRRLEVAQELSVLDHRRAERVRTQAYDAVQAVFDTHDVLVTPTLAIPPYEKDTEEAVLDGEPIDANHGWILTWPFNLTGNPVAAVPVGFVDGLPVGMQIVGPRLGDATVLRVAAAFERLQPWADHTPPV